MSIPLDKGDRLQVVVFLVWEIVAKQFSEFECLSNQVIIQHETSAVETQSETEYWRIKHMHMKTCRGTTEQEISVRFYVKSIGLPKAIMNKILRKCDSTPSNAYFTDSIVYLVKRQKTYTFPKYVKKIKNGKTAP